MFDDTFLEFKYNIRKSLRDFKKDILICYAVSLFAEIIIIYLLLQF